MTDNGRDEDAITTLDKFIGCTDPAVLFFKGPWGIGKTFFLRERYLKERELTPKEIYISLFGKGSISDIFKDISASFYEKKFQSYTENIDGRNWFGRWISKGRRGVDTTAPLLSLILGGSDVVNAFSEATALHTIRGRVVVIDDLERRDEKLNLKEVLGFISKLRDELKCRVILIANEDALGDDLQELSVFREKVVDKEFEYSPRITQNLIIGFSERLTPEITRYFTLAECNNIRVMSRTKQALEVFDEITNESDINIKQHVESQIAQICIFRYHFSKTISIADLVTTKYMMMRADSDEELSEGDNVLKKFNFVSSSIDKFIIAYLETGHLDRGEFKQTLEVLTENWNRQVAEIEVAELRSNIFERYVWNDDQCFNEAKKLYEKSKDNLRIPAIYALINYMNHSKENFDRIEYLERDIGSRLESLTIDQLNNIEMEIRDEHFDKLLAKAKTKKITVAKMSLSDLLEKKKANEDWNVEEIRMLSDYCADDFVHFLESEEDASKVNTLKRVIARFITMNTKEASNTITMLRQAIDTLANRNNINKLRNKYWLEELDKVSQHISAKIAAQKKERADSPPMIGGHNILNEGAS